MKYSKREDNLESFYEVTYNEEKLREILEELKKYSYTKLKKGQIGGSITRWPATIKNIRNRTISVFHNNPNIFFNGTIYPKTIVFDKEDNSVSFEYSYNKLPDLYHYIDIIVNEKSILNSLYDNLFEGYKKNMVYASMNQERLVLEGLLNYINSQELVNNNSNDKLNNPKYDYKGLCNLYQETLKCFDFKLIAVKEYFDKQKQKTLDGISIQGKK